MFCDMLESAKPPVLFIMHEWLETPCCEFLDSAVPSQI
jgi:hypothetical protein